MSNDDSRQALQAYLPRGVQKPKNADTIKVTPIVGFLLNSRWGWQRLQNIANAQTSYLEADARLQRAQEMLENLPKELAHERAVAQARHEHELASIQYEKKAIDFAHMRLQEEHERDVARIRAEKESYQSSGKPARQKHPNDAITDPDIRELRKELKRFIERKTHIDPLKQEAYEDIDRLVREKSITPEEGDELKRKVDEFISKKILR